RQLACGNAAKQLVVLVVRGSHQPVDFDWERDLARMQIKSHQRRAKHERAAQLRDQPRSSQGQLQRDRFTLCVDIEPTLYWEDKLLILKIVLRIQLQGVLKRGLRYAECNIRST